MNSTGYYSLLDFSEPKTGSSDYTGAFAKAAEAAAQAGGGVIIVPPGVFPTGPIRLYSNTELRLAPGATIRFSDDPRDYPLVNTRWGGNDCVALMPMLFADGAQNVSLTGKGTLDGNGRWWWETYRAMAAAGSPTAEWPHLAELKETLARVIEANGEMARFDTGGGGMESGFLRPPLLQFKDCRNITIEGVTCTNSAFWNCHMLYSEDITIHDTRFVSPADAPNTDGMDIDSCRGVRISDCVYDVGDDCLCLKSGIGREAMAVGRPTEEVVVSNCTMLRGHGGIVLGSEIAGGLRNIVISGCTFRGTDRGIRLKTRRERGGYVKNVR
ncbi:MAG: glycoside hydrolase family 28 protein, partial [Spirochaetales bacterium]|nr:glycoside hydrolase family 28 protein [Spirochaetales bacterium]